MLSDLTVRGLAAEAALTSLSEFGVAASIDRLYEVFETTPASSAVHTLAAELLRSRIATPGRSRAVDVALALSDAQTCQQKLRLLPRAAIEGDERALRSLMRLTTKTGCGLRGNDDCMPCLRHGHALSRAIVSIRKRIDAESDD